MHASMVGVCSATRAYIGRCTACRAASLVHGLARFWAWGLLAWGLSAGAKPPAEVASEVAYQQIEVLARALHDIETRAVTRPSVERLVQAAIRGMLREIDSESRHISAEELVFWENSPEAGETGLHVGEAAGHCIIEGIREDSPAQKAGLRKGDVLLSVDKQPVQGLSLAEVRSQLAGPVGSEAILLVKREGVVQPLRLRLKRALGWPSPLETRWVDTTWVVRLSRFSPGVAAELERQLPAVLHNKSASILLDLRGNLGGLLQEAFAVASLFLPPQTPMVRIEGPRAPHSRLEKALAPAAGSTQGAARIPLLVLMDKNSASVTEVVAAALRDNGRARLWGERSHGKGSIQEKLLLPDGSAIYLTVARFVRLTGAPIDGVGVEPDCPLANAKACKGPDTLPPQPKKPSSSEDTWLSLGVSWLAAQKRP